MRYCAIGAGMLLWACAAWTQASGGIGLKQDVVYGNAGGVDLVMDLATPKPGGPPAAAVVCIHGGGWQVGDKSAYGLHIITLAGNGFVGASINYRLAPKYPWPAQIDDAKTAVRYLRAHAKELNVDPARIAAMGDSAGGHLALLLGTVEFKDDSGEKIQWPGQSSKVQAVVNFSGPTDLRAWHALPEADAQFQKDFGTNSDGLLTALFGTADRTAPIIAQASPVAQVNTGDAPVLTFHGGKDPVVPLPQAQLLQEALNKA